MTLDISPEDQFVLSQYMYEVLKQHLGHDFTIVNQPGPGVMRLQITVIDLRPSDRDGYGFLHAAAGDAAGGGHAHYPTGPTRSPAPPRAKAR